MRAFCAYARKGLLSCAQWATLKSLKQMKTMNQTNSVLVRLGKALAVLFTSVFAFTIPFFSFAETVEFAGAQIEYSNAEVSYSSGAGDLILTFRNTAAPGTFSIT
ncbi:MAG: hypothetical protein J6R63_02815, partial [Kiritimatiellae bacterium]|nr:hypothetical protein [Kiritimatiellia bacterium]